jgi:hypothetical protein
MHHDGPADRYLVTLMGAFLLPLLVASGAVGGDWETVRGNYENALKANDKRIQEIEAKERGILDPQQRAEKITRDKIAAARASLKGGGTGKSLAEAAEKVSGDPKALADLSREQSKYLDAATGDWGAEGPERKRLREATAATQKNIERVNANLTRAAESVTSLQASDSLEKAARIEAAVNEAGSRLRARWQLEQAARERETKQREREAAERARGTGSK